MAKKVKKVRGDINSRNREKMRRACVRLDKVAALLGGIAALSLLLIWNKPYDLSTTGANGYPALFLLVLAGLPLELLETLFRFLELPELVKICGSYYMLGCGAFFTVVAGWLGVRFYVARHYGQSGIRIVVTIMQIIALWGLFQIFCFMTSSVLDDSSDDSVKQQMKHDSADKK